MKSFQSIIWMMIVGAILTLGGPAVGLSENGKSIEQMIAAAKTAADYEAIAVYYEQQAQAARQEQREHEEKAAVLARRYQAGPRKRTGSVAQHLASGGKDQGQAERYETLAETYRTLARTAQQPGR